MTVQALYEADVTGHPAVMALRRLATAARLSREAVETAGKTIEYVEGRRTELDRRIAQAAPQFPVDSMAAVDRNILRAALAEAALRPGTPRGVIVSEAVEVARLFGSESSPAFVNAVLGALLG
jgi:N utilization substance protein B